MTPISPGAKQVSLKKQKLKEELMERSVAGLQDTFIQRMMGLSEILQFLKKPEYIFKPKQIYSRIFYAREGDHLQLVHLPWGLKIEVHTNEAIGHSLCTLGVYDLGVTETLWRLIDCGERVIDVGANVGYMTSIMAVKVGAQGKVYAFEPHPQIFEELSKNVKLWQGLHDLRNVELRRVALSSKSGTGVLKEPNHFISNKGVAFIIANNYGEKHVDGTEKSRVWSVELRRLDELINDKEKIKVIKLDVEGHELEVLKGASHLISKHVRDIIFEDHGTYPTPVTQLLEEHNYTVLKISKGVLKPYLKNPSDGASPPWEPLSYLATRDAPRAIKRMRKMGWKSLTST